MTQVVVVGGGIAGLAAARSLAASGQVTVTVLDAAPRFGGKLASETLNGCRFDSGAESVLARRPEAVELIGALGLQQQLVHPTSAQPRILIDGRAEALPPSAMGIPTDVGALEAILSPDGLRRARQEPDRPSPALDADVGIGDYVDQRFGPEVTDRVLEPLLGGVYAGRARELSFEAVAPGMFDRARCGGSLLEHARAQTRAGASGPVFAGLVGGIATMIDALSEDLRRRGVTLRTGVTARELTGGLGHFALVCGPVPKPELITADAVVLAAPAAATGRLLAASDPVGRELAAMPYASMAVVTLIVRGVGAGDSGLLVPTGGLPTIKALTYSSSKWAWVAERSADAWGAGVSVVRASVGRFGEERLLQVDDATLLARTYAESSTLPGWESAELVTGRVTRWGGGLPQYLVGHRALVGRVRGALDAQPGLAACGAAYDGVGIAACLASAEVASAKILVELTTAPTAPVPDLVTASSHDNMQHPGRR